MIFIVRFNLAFSMKYAPEVANTALSLTNSEKALDQMIAEWYGSTVPIFEAPLITASRSIMGSLSGTSHLVSLGQTATGLGIHGNSVNSPKPAMYHHTFDDGAGNFKTYTGVGGVDGKRAWNSVERIQKNNAGWSLYDSKSTIAPNRKTAYQVEQLWINNADRLKTPTFNSRNSPGKKILNILNKIK